MIRTATSNRSRYTGAVIVEMAVILPVLLVIIMGIIEFGRAMMVANLLTTAAREGAREAALPDRNNTEIIAVVVNRLTSSSIPISSNDVTVEVNSVVTNASNAISGDTLTVTVTTTYGAVTWLPTSIFISPTNRLQGKAVMRRE